MSTTLNIYEGKFGLYPCDKETYKKLKRVRYYAHVERYQQARLEAWSRKLPKNRVRWVFDGFHSENAPGISYTKWKAEPWEKPELCPVNLHLLASEYRKTKPVQTPEEVQQLSLRNGTLDDLIEQAEAWLKRIGRDKR